jgi:xanthine dehydrogenase YagS FAD-binding subunit
MANALYALDATVKVQSADGRERTTPIADFNRLPDDMPEKDTNLQHGELVTAIELPKSNFAKNSYYLKVRDRASYAFALVAVAAALELDRGTISQARIVLGGVAHKPWRSREAERRRSPVDPHLRRASGRLPKRRSETRSRSRTTPSRSSWGSGPSFAR